MLVVRLAVLLCACAVACSAAARATYPGAGRLQFNSALHNWTDAVKTCADFGGYLAVAQTPGEAFELLRLMELKGVEGIQYGVHDLFSEGRHLTLLDQPLENVGYQSWAADAANQSDLLNCVSLTSHESLALATERITLEGLTPSNCSELLPSICQFPLWDSYLRVGDFGYYKLHTDIQEWHAATEVCRQEGASMLVLRSQQEFDALLDQFGDEISHRFIYYGAHHMFGAYNFVTIYGESLGSSGYEAWAPNEPGNFGSAKRAVALGISSRFPEKGFSLSDETNLRPFICKHELFW